MKHILVPQNSEEWYRERLGKPTASKFDKIITPAGGKTREPWYDYMYQLVYERIVRKPMNIVPATYWTERGRLLEPAAAKEYVRITGHDVSLGGFILTDDRKVGCSPDRIVNEKHGVEIKCPAPWQHIQYICRGPEKDYKAQIQGQMYVAEFDRVDFFSYNPGMPCVVCTIYRDDEYIKIMSELLNQFTDELDKAEAKARSLGNYFKAEMDIEPAAKNNLDG
jgi:hypothetical protein